MISKIALFLLALVILAGAVSRWRRSDAPPGKAIEPARKCPECGSYVMGAGPGPCARADCPNA